MWPETIRSFDDFVVRCSANDLLVQDITKIIEDQRLKTGSMKAQRRIPIEARADDIDEDWPGYEMDTMELEEAANTEQAWSSSHYERGFGSPAHPELRHKSYDSWAAAILMELCRQSDKGVVLKFGKYNSSCQFGTAPYLWSNADKIWYDQHHHIPAQSWNLSKYSIVLRVSFLNLRWRKSWHPYNVSQTETAAPMIARSPPSIVICDTFPYHCQRIPHGRFIIPSDHLPPRLTHNQYFQLKNGEALIDQYLVDEDDIIDTLSRFISGSSEVPLGLDDDPVKTAPYCSSIGDVLQCGADDFAKAVEGDKDATLGDED